jgi:hypothetical protein
MRLTWYLAITSYTGRHPSPRSHRGSHTQSRARRGAVWRRHTSTAIGEPTVFLGSWIATPLLLMIDKTDICSRGNEAKLGPAVRRACELPIDATRSP